MAQGHTEQRGMGLSVLCPASRIIVSLYLHDAEIRRLMQQSLSGNDGRRIMATLSCGTCHLGKLPGNVSALQCGS